jgi:hypothetical protein
VATPATRPSAVTRTLDQDETLTFTISDGKITPLVEKAFGPGGVRRLLVVDDVSQLKELADLRSTCGVAHIWATLSGPDRPGPGRGGSAGCANTLQTNAPR